MIENQKKRENIEIKESFT